MDVLYFMNEWIWRLILCKWYFSCLEMYSENFFDICFHGLFQIFLRVYKHSQKKRKDNLDGSLDQISFCSWTLVPENTSFQATSNTSNVNVECVGNQTNCILYLTSFLEHWCFFTLLISYKHVSNWLYLV